jgi:hypothetical protein
MVCEKIYIVGLIIAGWTVGILVGCKLGKSVAAEVVDRVGTILAKSVGGDEGKHENCEGARVESSVGICPENSFTVIGVESTE